MNILLQNGMIMWIVLVLNKIAEKMSKLEKKFCSKRLFSNPELFHFSMNIHPYELEIKLKPIYIYSFLPEIRIIYTMHSKCETADICVLV